MSIVDFIILLIIISGALLGFKRGFTKELVSFIGFILVLVFAFILKNPVSYILYDILPFFKFGGIFKGVVVLNIVLYEIIAFLLVFSILSILLRVLLLATSIFEKILNATIVLGIPSKILGAILGAIQYYVVSVIVLYVCSLPVFDIKMLEDSKWKNNMLNSTPIISGVLDNTIEVFNEFGLLKEKYEYETNATNFNLESLYLFLKYDIIKPDAVRHLVNKDKLKIDNVECILQAYENKNEDINVCMVNK